MYYRSIHKPETTKIHREKLLDIDLGSGFLDMTPGAQEAALTKINKITSKVNLHTTKETINRTKRQSKVWKKISINHNLVRS